MPFTIGKSSSNESSAHLALTRCSIAFSRASLPDAGCGLFPQQLAHLVVQQDIRSLRVVGAADQEQIALSRGDAGTGDADGIGAARLLAHEGAR